MPDNKVDLTVQTLSGTYTDEFNVHQKLRHVEEKAFEHLGIVPAPGDEWQLSYQGTVLDLDLSIEDAHVPDHATLLLAVKEGGGGSR